MTDPAGHLTDELSALLDGELSPGEDAAARAHLSACTRCTAELAAFDRTRSLVRGLPMVDPPNVVSLSDRAAAAAQAAEAAPPDKGDAADTAGPFPFVAAAAAIVFVLMQWLPAERPVSPSLAGFGRTHSSVVASSAQPPPSQSAGSAGVPAKLVSASSRVGEGMRRVGVYRKGKVVHAVYSDGTHALSVFAEPGELAERGLPDGGEVVRMGEHTLHHWNREDGDVVLWESDGVVYTAVGDAPVEQVMAAAASMPDEEPDYSMGQRFRRGCRALAEALTGG